MMALPFSLSDSRYAGDALGVAVLGACREEIETYRELAGYYGYLLLVMSAGPPSPVSP
jgi:hypothetical protein